MNVNKQQLLLEYLVSSVDTFALTKKIVEPSYFDPSLRQAAAWIAEYYDKYNALPTPDQVYAETSVELKTHSITRDQIKYCSDEVAEFCKRKAIEQAITSAPALIKAGDYGAVETLVKNALMVSLTKNLGIDYFDSPLDRLEGMLTKVSRTSVGFGDAFDDLIGGGLARTEMLLFTANSGGGKSIAMGNIAMNFVKQGLNVLYVSLELSEQMISQRFDQMLTGIPQAMWESNYSKIAETITRESKGAGRLTVVRMPVGTNANAIRAYLKEYELTHGIVPDLLVVDYLDLMSPNEKVSADNISEKDKRSAEQLRDIGFDYDMFIVSASQQNRSAIEAPEINQSHIAGGITKINTVDIGVSIILTPTMKAAGEIGFTFIKTRSSDGVGKTTYCVWDSRYLKISPPKKTVDDDPIESRYTAPKSTGVNKISSLEDIYLKYGDD